MNIRQLIDILLHFIFPASLPVCEDSDSTPRPECRDVQPVYSKTGVLTRSINGLTVYSSLIYDAGARTIIDILTRDDDTEAFSSFGRHMAVMFGKPDVDCLIPAPLNQHSLELAEGMCEVWRDISISDSMDIRGKRVALVDVVCVSGLSLSNLAETCRREGAEVICAYTFAADGASYTIKPTAADSFTQTDDKDSQPDDSDSLIDDAKAKRYDELSRFFSGDVIIRRIRSLMVYSACDYHTSGIREEIHKFKYSGAIGLCSHFGRHMAERFGECEADYLLPVPLHLNSERNYNQTLELAKEMCELWDVKILDAAVWTREIPNRARSKTRDDITPSDFSITRDIAGKRIALIDDVCTSGNTLSCLAESCTRAGAIIICAYTLAST